MGDPGVKVYQEQLAALSTSVPAPDEIHPPAFPTRKALRRIAERFYCRWLEGFSDDRAGVEKHAALF